jgi:sterol desaturase/sphingolipid hydroxylase (fatty acid hydroxylase superfamily)
LDDVIGLSSLTWEPLLTVVVVFITELTLPENTQKNWSEQQLRTRQLLEQKKTKKESHLKQILTAIVFICLVLFAFDMKITKGTSIGWYCWTWTGIA